MLCSSCGFRNTTGVKFCGECGSPLKLQCPSCGFENAPGIKFCGECGKQLIASDVKSSLDPRSYTPKHLAEKILTSRSALEGERKHVTVLFADLKGSMDLSESIDPEEWHRIMERFFKILTDGVHRFEGTVNQYTGDGIMALFGAPIAHEDHAQRACYAALALQEDLRRYANELRLEKGISFSVRMGMNSGEVVVGKIGDDLRMDYTALGHTASLAARMEQIAEPGKAYLTEHTAKLVDGFVSLRDLGRYTVKGVKEPVGVYELDGLGGLRTKLDRSRARGFSRFVGREREIAALESALDQTLAGNGQVVGIVAEPGVGKSRLCFELAERCRRRGLPVLEGHCPAHGKAVAYVPILELWRSYFGISETDTATEARRKVAGTLFRLDEDFREFLPPVLEFLGVGDPDNPPTPTDPEARQRQLLDFQRRLADAQSRHEPLVVLIDDLHWIDPASETFIADFAEAIDGWRILFLVNFRPEYDGSWMSKISVYQRLSLLPLGPEATGEMLDDLLGKDASLSALHERIRSRTGGNPFFIEEAVLSLAESGVLTGSQGNHRLGRPTETVEIPATVQAVLAARIDRLAEPEKALLQTASVIGKSVPQAILKKVAALPEFDLAARLSALRQGQFLYDQALYPEAVHAFKHPLTQEVAYKSQLTERRRHVHAAVARAIEEVRANRLDEEAGVLAHHWEEAANPLEAARWHARAARWTEDTDPPESLRRWHTVRALLAGAVESPETRSLRLEACRGILSAHWRVGGSDADAVFADGKAIAEEAGDLRTLAFLYNLYGNAKGTAGDLRTYYQYALEALQLAERAGDTVIHATIAADAHALLTGRLREAVLLAEKGIALGARDLSLGRNMFGTSTYLAGLCVRGLALVEMGRLKEAARDLDRASEYPAEQPLVFIWSQAWRAIGAYRGGDPSGALTHARRAVERAEQGGGPINRIVAYVALGIAHLANREWRATEDAEHHAIDLARERGIGFGTTALALRALAEARLGEGNSGAGLDLADRALADARQSGGRLFEIDALITRARALLRSGGASRAAEAERTLAEASALIEATEARCHTPSLHEVSAEIARLRGDDATRHRELREAHQLFVEIGAPLRAAEVAKELES